MSGIEARNQWAVLARAWYKAKETGQDYKIPCESYQEAVFLRNKLYKCIRRARTPRAREEELVTIAETHSVTISNKLEVIIYPKQLHPSLRKVMGKAEGAEVAASEKAFLEKLQGIEETSEVEEIPPNPYYTR